MSVPFTGAGVSAADRIPRVFSPSAIFRGAVALHIFLWTLLPIIAHRNAPLDVIEGMAWAREWRIGYSKGPPVFAWLLGLTDPLPAELRLAVIYLLSQLCIAVTFYGVWRLGRRLYSPSGALLSVLLMEGVYYFGFPTPELNEIVLQMPISALLGWVFHRALTDDKRRDWLLVGALAALGMWTRYSMAVLLLSLFLFMLLPSNWQRLRSRGPLLAVLSFAVLWSPHAWWLVTNGLQSVGYVSHRAHHLHTLREYGVVPLRFALAQFLALVPVLGLVVALAPWSRDRRNPGWQSPTRVAVSRDGRLYALALGLGPFVVAELMSLASGLGLRSMWGGPLWCFSGLAVVAIMRPALGRDNGRRLLIAWATCFILPLIAYGIVHGLRPVFLQAEKRSSFPGPALASAVTGAWHDATGGGKLRYVVGDMWLAGNVAFYAPDRPSVYQDGDPALAPWVDDEAIRREGGILLWHAGLDMEKTPPQALLDRFPTARIQPVLSLPKRCLCVSYRSNVGWAIIPPAGN